MPRVFSAQRICVLVATVFSAYTGSSQDVAHPLQIEGDVTPPVLIRQVEPKFSSKMRAHAAERDVLVHLVLDEQGRPINPVVLISETDSLTPDPEFNKSALKAVEQYRFRPALRQGKAVAVELNISIHFAVLNKQ